MEETHPASPTPPRIRDLPEDDRPREKLSRLGPSSLSEAELLALFFGTGRPGASAVDLGRELIQRFGSLRALSRLTVEELRQVSGIGPAKSTQLAAVFEFGRRLARERYRDLPVDSPEAVYDLLGPEMRALTQESVRLVLLDNRSNLLHVSEVTRGTLNECIAHPRDIFRIAIGWSAASFILVHNHPSGNPSPSQADIALTRQLRDAAAFLHIEMHDHVIIGAPSESESADAYYSFRESGLI